MGGSPPIRRDDALLRELWAAGMTARDIGHRFGASRTWVSDLVRKLDLPRRATDATKLPGALIEGAYVDHRMTLDAIVAQLRPTFPTISRGMVRRRLAIRGVTMRGPTRRDPDVTTACVRLRRAGLDYPEIGRRLGLTDGQVGERCRKVLGAGKRGTFTRVDVSKLIALRKRGMSLRAIGAHVGLSNATVHYHLQRARRPA